MSFSVSEILAFLGQDPAAMGRVVNQDSVGEAQSKIRVNRPAPLAGSTREDLAFFFSKDHQHELLMAHPGILITGEPFVKPLESSGLPLWKSSTVIACRDPYLAMAVLSAKFAEKLSTVGHLAPSHQGAPIIHPSAVVDPTAKLGAGVQVGAHCTVDKNVQIGAGTILYSGCTVGPSVVIGEDCVFFPRVTIYEWTQIGNRARIHAGCVLGADGFGYAPKVVMTEKGPQVTGHQKIFHLGRVVIGDDVEMGANSLVDRSTFGDTVIGKNVKMDNHVHVGHNAHVDEGAILCGGVCLAGSASVGKYAYIGGMAGISNKVHVGDGGKVGGMTLVSKDVPPGGNAVGNPQREHSDHFRVHALLNKLSAERKKKNGIKSDLK